MESESPIGNEIESGSGSGPPPSSTPTPNGGGRFSRVFSESDEIKILKCLIRATKSTPPPITTVGAQIIERIVKRLNYKYASSQINDKVRRLRIKYHKHAKNKYLVKTHHDRRLFKLSKKIWAKKIIPKKNTINTVAVEDQENEDGDGAGDMLGKFPYLAAEFSKVFPENEVWKLKMKGLEEHKLRKMDQEWVFLKVEEAKLVAKKAELMQRHIMEIIDGTGSSNGFN